MSEKKKWAILIVSIFIIFSCLIGAKYNVEKSSRFKVVEKLGNNYSIIVDRETGVGYLGVNGRVQTVMYDADGNIYRPNGWRDNG